MIMFCDTRQIIIFRDAFSSIYEMCKQSEKSFAVGTFGHKSASLILLVNATMAGLLQKILVNFSFLSFRWQVDGFFYFVCYGKLHIYCSFNFVLGLLLTSFNKLHI